MYEFRNKIIRKSQIKNTKKIIIMFIIMVISMIGFAFSMFENYNDIKNIENYENMNNIISDSWFKTTKLAYVNVSEYPIYFAKSEESDDLCCIATDGTYMYIVKMTPNEYSNLTNNVINSNSYIKIYGTTQKLSKSLKNLAIQEYNKNVEESLQLNEGNFENYFGNIYLDTTKKVSNEGIEFIILGTILLIIGSIGFYNGIDSKFNFEKLQKNFEEKELEKIDKSLNKVEETRTNLFVTNKYLISIKNKLEIIDYKDIVWMYKNIQKLFGLNIYQEFVIITKNSKKYNLGKVYFSNENELKQIDELYEEVTLKNKKMIIGYNRNNIEKAKMLLKENKRKGLC